MYYILVTLPAIAFVGIVGGLVSLVRGRRRSAAILLLVGVVAIGLAIALSYASV